MKIQYNGPCQPAAVNFSECQPGHVYQLLMGKDDISPDLRMCIQVADRNILYMVDLESGKQCNSIKLDEVRNGRDWGAKYIEVADAVITRAK